MSGNQDAHSLFQKVAILFTSTLAVIMTIGGIVYYTYSDSLIANLASLTISGVGGYVLKGVLLPGWKVGLETVRNSWELTSSIIKYIIRHLFLRA